MDSTPLINNMARLFLQWYDSTRSKFSEQTPRGTIVENFLKILVSIRHIHTYLKHAYGNKHQTNTGSERFQMITKEFTQGLQKKLEAWYTLISRFKLPLTNNLLLVIDPSGVLGLSVLKTCISQEVLENISQYIESPCILYPATRKITTSSVNAALFTALVIKSIERQTNSGPSTSKAILHLPTIQFATDTVHVDNQTVYYTYTYCV